MSTTKKSQSQDRTTATYLWATRCIPAFGVFTIVTILVFAFVIKPFGKGDIGHHHGQATPWQLVLSAYTVILHVMSIVFPARVCMALANVTKKIQENAKIKDDPEDRKTFTVENKKGNVTYPLPLFVIILPAYKEEMSTLEETLRVLAAHPQALHSYHVCVSSALAA